MFDFLRYTIEGIAQDVSYAFSNVTFAASEAANTVIGVASLPLLVGFCLFATVCNLITPDTIREEIPKQLDNETLKKAFAAKVKEKEKDFVSVSILDEWDEEMGKAEIKGEGVSDDIYVGMVISLK